MANTQRPSPIAAGLAGRCPHCGQGRLFNGFLTLAPRCESCGLDFSFADAGDGPAIFVILFAGFVVVGLALVVEFLYQPPFWLHGLLWTPLILLVTLGPLRAFKGILIALQYHHDAAEGRLDRGGQHDRGGRVDYGGQHDRGGHGDHSGRNDRGGKP